jgi:Bacterial EndoU nuclease
MALDRPYDDGASEAPLERRGHRGGSDADAAAAAVETRTRLEYYEVIRAADGGRETDRSGWDAIAAEDRPQLDALRVTPERTAHVLDGDGKGGGGHRHGTGQPGKTEFPVGWDDQKVIDTLLDVARRPDQTPQRQEWNGRWAARGTRDDVEIVVVVARDGQIWTGFPRPGGPGVVKNPEES